MGGNQLIAQFAALALLLGVCLPAQGGDLQPGHLPVIGQGRLAPAPKGKDPTGVIDVLSRGGSGDARAGTDGVVSGTAFESASLNATRADKGKLLSMQLSGAGFSAKVARVTSKTTLILSRKPPSSQGDVAWTLGTDNCTPIRKALASVPLNTGMETGAQVYFPAGDYLTSCGIAPSRGSSSGNGGVWLVGAGPYVSRIIGANSISSGAIVTFNQLAGNPSGISDLAITAAVGGTYGADCLDLINGNGVFLDRDWFAGCKYNVYASNFTGLWIDSITAEWALQREFYFTGQVDGRVTNVETYDYGAPGSMAWDFEGVAPGATDRLLVSNIDDINATGDTSYGLRVKDSSNIDFGPFQFKGNNNYAKDAVYISGSSHISLIPKISNNANGVYIDSTSSDIQVSGLDDSGGGTPIYVESGAADVRISPCVSGPITLAGGVGEFAAACVQATSVCAPDDQTAPNAVEVAPPASGSVALAGHEGDVVTVICE